MGYLWYDLENLKGGQIVKINDSIGVNVKLMSYDCFSLYRLGLPYRFYGGTAITDPCHITVPYDGSWILVCDLSHPGIFSIKGVSVLTDDERQSEADSVRKSLSNEKALNDFSKEKVSKEKMSQNYKALVIGVNEYQCNQQYRDLKAVHNDADAISQLLNNSPLQYQTTVMRGKNATHNKIRRELEHFFNSDSNDVLFLYWAGHGTGSRFVAYDTDPTQENDTGIDIAFLGDLIEKTDSTAVVVVLDCCFSGAIARSASNYSLNIDGDGKVIMASSDYYQESYESNGLGHGVFTYHFLEGLGGKAANANGTVTVTSLHDYICTQIDDTASNKQTPVFKATFAGTFVINKIEPSNQSVNTPSRNLYQQVNDRQPYAVNTLRSEANPQKFDKINIGEVVLLKAATLDSNEEIQKSADVICGRFIETHNLRYVESEDRRKYAKMESAISALVRKGLLEQTGGKGDIFKVSVDGYDFADRIDDTLFNDGITCIENNDF